MVSKLDADTGEEIRNRSLDTASVGVQRQNQLREASSGDGFVEEALWTGVGRARSGAASSASGSAGGAVMGLRGRPPAGA